MGRLRIISFKLVLLKPKFRVEVSSMSEFLRNETPGNTKGNLCLIVLCERFFLYHFTAIVKFIGTVKGLRVL